MNPFQTLGLNEESATEQDTLRAWRRLARDNHPDKQAPPPDDARMKELNEAKEACLEAIVTRTCTVDEREFVLHIARLVEKSLAERVGLTINLQDGHLIQPYLREHMRLRAIDAMEWVLRCAMGVYDFDQDVEDEIPILCSYYNGFLKRDNWTEDEFTFMVVLNKYDELKAKGYGNFAQFLENP